MVLSSASAVTQSAVLSWDCPCGQYSFNYLSFPNALPAFSVQVTRSTMMYMYLNLHLVSPPVQPTTAQLPQFCYCNEMRNHLLCYPSTSIKGFLLIILFLNVKPIKLSTEEFSIPTVQDKL